MMFISYKLYDKKLCYSRGTARRTCQ